MTVLRIRCDLFRVVLASLCFSGVFGQVSAEESLPPSASGRGPVEFVRVVSDDNYPPYLFRNADGAVEGYLVDLWQLWEKKPACLYA